jgi:hypothetical protein
MEQRYSKHIALAAGYSDNAAAVTDRRLGIAELSPHGASQPSRRYPSRCRPERLLDVLRKRVANSAIVFAVAYREQPAADEGIDLGAVNFDGETAKAGPTPRSATPHPYCSIGIGGFGSDRRSVRVLLDHVIVDQR